MIINNVINIIYMFISLNIIIYYNTHNINVIAIKGYILESRNKSNICYLNYKILNNLSHIYSKAQNKSSQSDDFYRNLHREALDARDFQLSIPPTTDDKISPITELVDDSDKNLQAKETDVMKLVEGGIIPEFRYPKTTKSETNVLSWHIDRPPDIYIIKFEGVLYLYPKESAIISYNAANYLLGSYTKFIMDIPLYYYHLFLHSLPYISDKLHHVLLALKYITTLHDQIDYKSINESIENLNRVNESSDPFQPFVTYTGSNKRSKPFMMDITNDVLGIKNFIEKNHSLFKSLNLSDFDYSISDIISAYDNQKSELESLDSWDEAFLYRNSIPISDESSDRFHHVSFNYAVAQAILHHIKIWRMPVYITSNFYNITELERRVLSILKRVSNSELGDSIKYISLHGNSSKNTVSEIVSMVGLEDDILPVHVFSDRHEDLNSISLDRRNLHLHFVDWGHSTYKEKLLALYNPEMNYLNHTKQLVSLMCLPSTNTGRCWNTGYQLLSPITEVGKFLESWKRKWKPEQDKSEPPYIIN